MKDYHAIFTRYANYSLAELQNLNDSGAKIELAIRQNDRALSADALESLDNDTYNIISCIKLLEGEHFKECIRKLRVALVPALTTYRRLNLVVDSDVLLYAVDKLADVAEGLLGSIIKHLNILRKKVIKSDSLAFKQLIEFNFSPYAIYLLNYKWYRGSASDSNLKKLQSNLLSALCESETPFDDLERGLILEILNDHPRHYSATLWSEDYELCGVTNYDNWLWLLDLTRKQVLSFNCIIIDTLQDEYNMHFRALNEYEKLQCFDDALARVAHVGVFKERLETLQFTDYLQTLHRELDQKAFHNAVKLGLIKPEEYSLDTQKRFVRGLKHKEAFQLFMSNVELQNVEMLSENMYGYYSYSVQIHKEFLTEDEQRELISKVLDIYYDKGEDDYIRILVRIISDENLAVLYSRELLLDIIKAIKETFNNRVHFSNINNMLRNVLSEEEYTEYINKQEEEKELARLAAAEEATARKIQYINETFAACQNYDELLYEYEQFKGSYNYTTATVNTLLLEALAKVRDNWDTSYSYTKLNYYLWDANVITHEEFIDVISENGGVVNA